MVIHTYAYELTFKGQSVQQIEWKQTDGRTLPIALPPRLTQSSNIVFFSLLYGKLCLDGVRLTRQTTQKAQLSQRARATTIIISVEILSTAAQLYKKNAFEKVAVRK